MTTSAGQRSSTSDSGAMLPRLLLIFSSPSSSISLCIQMRAIAPVAGPLRLGDLVLVVREDEVDAAPVDREAVPQGRLGHRRALDVPARAPGAPGGVPGRVLAVLVPLPEGEVEGRLLPRARARRRSSRRACGPTGARSPGSARRGSRRRPSAA